MARRKRATVADLEAKLMMAQMQLSKEQRLRRWEAAKDSRRTENWYTTAGGANTDLRTAWRRLVSRHRDLVDNNPWADRAVRVKTNSAIGDGVMGTPRNASRRYIEAYQEWAESTDCDWHGRLNFYGLQSLIYRTVSASGSCLVRRRIDPAAAGRGLIPLRLEVLEPDWLDMDRDNGITIQFGQQFTESGQLEGYWIRQSHPGEKGWSGTRIQSDFVPASEILCIYDVRRPGQRLGVPDGASVIISLRDIDDIQQAQLLKTKIASCFTAFVYDSESPDQVVATAAELTDTLEPGAIEILPPGKQITFANPPSSGDFTTDMRHYLHAVAAGYSITYEALTGILNDVNFSSGRMGWIEAFREVARLRWNVIVPQLLTPIGRWFNEAAATVTMRGPRQMIWTFPRRELIDPSKEIEALIQAVAAGIMSLSEVQRSLGYVPTEVISELGQDKAAAEAAGLQLKVFAADAVSNGSGVPAAA
jgi:lambda family phage portal protein